MRPAEGRGRERWGPDGETLDEGLDARDKLKAALEAQSQGLTVTEMDDLTNANRVTIKQAVDKFLELKIGKAKKTRSAYRLHLYDFLESLDRRTKYMDEITANTLCNYRH